MDGKRILCVDCHNKVMESKEKRKEDSLSAVKEPSDSVKLVCLDCEYHFSVKKASKVRLRCPYCGNNRLAKDDMTAERIIEEVSKLK